MTNASIDQVRHFWDTRPCNIGHSAAPLYSPAFDREVTLRKLFVEPHLGGFSEFGRCWGRVLDVGCGIGTQSLEFAKGGNEVLGIDVSLDSLTVARFRATLHPELKSRVEFIRRDVEYLDLPVGYEQFDLIYCWGVLHHTPDPLRFLRSLRQYAGDRTVLKLMVYNRWSWKQLRIRLGLDRPEAQAGCPIARTYTGEEIAQLLGRSGFSIVSSRVDHIFPYRIPDYRAGRYVKQWYFRGLPSRLFRWIEQEAGWHLMVEARA